MLHVCMKMSSESTCHVNITCKKRRYSEAQTWLERLQATAKKGLNVLQRGLRGGSRSRGADQAVHSRPSCPDTRPPTTPWLGSNLGDAILVTGPDRVIRGGPTAHNGLRHHLAEVCTLTRRAATPGVGRRRCAKVCRDQKGQPMRRTHQK